MLRMRRASEKNGLVRQWARQGTRPRQPADQRYESAYLFGAICLACGRDAGVALRRHRGDVAAPRGDLGQRRSRRACRADIAPAGTHHRQSRHAQKTSRRSGFPRVRRSQSKGEHLAILARQLALNHVFETFDDIIDAICDAWNKLIAQPKLITSNWSARMGPRRSNPTTTGYEFFARLSNSSCWRCVTQRPIFARAAP